MAVDPDAATLTRVKTLAGASSRPVLTDDEVKASVQNYPMPDVNGLTVQDADWVQTWNINAAVAELWGIKAGKVAGDFTFSADGSSFNKGDVMAHCLAMEQRYAAKLAGSAATTRYTTDPLHGVVING